MSMRPFTPTRGELPEHFADTARAARVRTARMPTGAVHVYRWDGRETIGILRPQLDGSWRGVPDVTGAATASHADPSAALAALMAAVAEHEIAACIAAHPAGGAR